MTKKRGFKKEDLNLRAILENADEAVEKNIKFEKNQQKSKKRRRERE